MRKVSLLVLGLGMALSGCGGASDLVSPFAGNWSGDFTLKRIQNGSITATINGTAVGTVSSSGVVHIKFYKQQAPDIYDEIASDNPADTTLTGQNRITGQIYNVQTITGGSFAAYNSDILCSLSGGQMIGSGGGMGDTTNSSQPASSFTIDFSMTRQ